MSNTSEVWLVTVELTPCSPDGHCHPDASSLALTASDLCLRGEGLAGEAFGTFPVGQTLVLAGAASLAITPDHAGFYRVTCTQLDRAWWSPNPAERAEQQQLRDVLPEVVLQYSLLRSHLGQGEQRGVLYFRVINRL